MAEINKSTLQGAGQDYDVEFDNKNGPKYMICQACFMLPLLTMGLVLPCLPCVPYCQYKEFKSQNATITDKHLVYKAGWLKQVDKIISLDRIQDVTVTKQPNFDMNVVVIYTTVSKNPEPSPEVILVAPKNAEMVRDIIMQRREALLFGNNNKVALQSIQRS